MDWHSPRGSAARITLLYVLFGVLWIFATDSMVFRWSADREGLTALQGWKGVGFVFLTTLILYEVLRRQFLRLEREVCRRRERERQIERLNRLYATLSDVNQTIVRSTSLRELLDEVCKVTARHTGFRTVRIGRFQRERMIIEPVAIAGEGSGSLDHEQMPVNGSQDLISSCLLDGRPCIVNDLWAKADSLTRGKAEEYGWRALSALPIMFKGEAWGAIVVYAGELNAFGDQEVALLAETASDIAFAMEGMERKELQKAAEAALREREAWLQGVVDSATGLLWVKDLQGRFVLVNRYMESMHGRPAEELIGRTVFDLHPRTEAEEYSANDRRVLETGRPVEVEEATELADGRHVFHSVKSPLRDREGKIYGIAAICTDITERKHAEETLRLQSSALEAAANGIVITDRSGVVRWTNEAFSRLTGYSKKEIEGITPRVLKSGHQNEEFYQNLWQTVLGGSVWRGELVNRHKDGHLYHEDMTITPVRDDGDGITHFIAIKQDITDRKRGDEALRDSLREKEALLKEVHHRVKNNLQLIYSLLRLEEMQVKDQAARAVLVDTQTRIRSMALLHETLYSSGDLAWVDLEGYMEKLAVYLRRSLSGSDRVSLRVEASAKVRLALDEAVPCGLIVNELVTNSLKHAFPDGREGEVVVKLEQRSDHSLRVQVSDNGVGLPPEVDLKNVRSLGLQLVEDLTRQLGGELQIECGKAGTVFVVTFCVQI